MKIVVQDGGQAFAHILETVKRDPNSWSQWLTLYITITKDQEHNPLPADTYLVNQIAQIDPHLDGVAYLVDERQLFILCRDIESHALRRIGVDVCSALFGEHGIAASHAVYAPKRDWRHMAECCPSANTYYGFLPPEEDGHGELHQALEIMQDILELNLAQRKLRSNTHILLVEDDAVTRKIFSSCLPEDNRLITSGNARDAVTQYALHAPDIVFLDIGLSDFSGHSVLEAIKAYDPEAYIVMLSGHDFIENIACTLESGAIGFIGKPFNKSKLDHYLQAYDRHKLPSIAKQKSGS